MTWGSNGDHACWASAVRYTGGRSYCRDCGKWTAAAPPRASWWQRLLVPPFMYLFAVYAKRRGLYDAALARAPELVIGPDKDPQTRRFMLFKRNGWQMVLHEWNRSDHDRALHDHSGDSWSLLLIGNYVEVISHNWETLRFFVRRTGGVYFRRAEMPHRVVIDCKKGKVYTLWFRMPPRREWGFACPKGWRHNSQYISDRNYYDTKSSVVGQGCG